MILKINIFHLKKKTAMILLTKLFKIKTITIIKKHKFKIKLDYRSNSCY